LSPLYLQDDDWNRLKVMIDILHPFFDATEILSTSTYPTISDVRLTIFGLIRHLDFFLEDSLDDNDYLFIEFKIQNKNISTTEQHEKAINMLQNQMKNYNNNHQHNHVISNTKKNKRLFFESLLTEPSSSPSIEDEITRYITAPVTSDTNPLDCIQGSSVPSEQVFSMATNVITKIRCNLKPESACAVMRLKSWIPKIRDKQDNENDLDVEILSES
ncbi:7486_t:CDS:2, partial [Cetraspora pellucida]